MEFFYAKIGEGNKLADRFLSSESPIGQPAIPIFFDCRYDNRDDFLKKGGAKKQGQDFFRCGDYPDDKRIIVIHSGWARILKPKGHVIFRKVDDASEVGGHAKPGEYAKLLPVEEVSCTSVAEAPGVISSMAANPYYYTGTFRNVPDGGNNRGLEFLSGEEISHEKIKKAKALLLCLGSIELETLIAKIFEEKGCFVPAYRGGALRDVDVIARNKSEKTVTVGDITIKPFGSASIQVKRKNPPGNKPKGCDYLISPQKNADQIISCLKTLPTTRNWLNESLNWIPEDIRISHGIM